MTFVRSHQLIYGAAIPTPSATRPYLYYGPQYPAPNYLSVRLPPLIQKFLMLFSHIDLIGQASEPDVDVQVLATPHCATYYIGNTFRKDKIQKGMSARIQVDRLLSIIKDAAYNALEQYETTGVPTPILDSNDGHPLDHRDDNITLKKIICTLEGACEQLCTTLAPPSHTINNRAQDYTWACLQVAVQLKLADELAEKPDGLHVDDLAAKVNVSPMKLASVLRVLAARHCFREATPDTFANNRLSTTLMSDSSLSALVDLIVEEGQTPAALLPQYLIDPEYGKSLSMTKALFQYRRRGQGTPDRTFYEWMQMKESQDRRQVMMKAMHSMHAVIGSQAALHAYPWNNVNSVCDVGSGLGAFSRSLLERFPEVHVAQFDLAPTIAIAEQHWSGAFADRNKFVSGDFLVDIPIKNCDVYYLRTILHNWTDENAVTILKTVKRAMGSNSRVLVHDHVLRHICAPSGTDSTDGLEIAPEPMLPNFGAGASRLYYQDLSMVMCYNTRERTTNEAISIGNQAGLHLVRVIDLAEMCLIEFDIEEK